MGFEVVLCQINLKRAAPQATLDSVEISFNFSCNMLVTLKGSGSWRKVLILLVNFYRAV